MDGLSKKVYLALAPPDEDDPVSDHRRIRRGLEERGFAPVSFPLAVLRQIHPMLRSCGGAITLTIARREGDWAAVAVEPGDTRQHHYGLAVDYGSTTIVMQLVDMNSGAVVGEEKAVNRQIAYGTDILTRITCCMEDPSRREEIRRVTVETFEELLARLTENTGVDAHGCPVMCVAGNTAMVHFLLQLDAWTVFSAPYAPVTTDPGWFWGRELGMDFSGILYFVPAASNYIGGDIVSGLLKADLQSSEQTKLFFDVGTNGELVIGNREWMLAGAGAAGPALEGYISRDGMRAAPGAIDTIRIRNGALTFTTIPGRRPVGICGSGIIDLLAQMRLNGWLNIAGELEPKASERIRYLPDQRQYAVAYALAEESESGTPLYFTQTDIRQYLDTKAAAYTMIQCLLEAAGIEPEELEQCILSGAFPAHSNLESAITIGIFPDLPRERYACIPNASLDGARMLLLDRRSLKTVKTLSETLYCVQFASMPDFLLRMQAARFLPNTDLSSFPTIRRRLEKIAEEKEKI